MSMKQFQFLAWSWFCSTLICVIMEGTGTLGGHGMRTVINDLSPITWFNIGNLLTVPVFNFTFFRGVERLLTWDYSFYTGYYQFIRYFWMTLFSGAAVWGIATNFTYLYGQVINLFRLVGSLI